MTDDSKNTQMIYTRISRELHRALQQQARADRRTIAATLALALEEYIQRHAPRGGRDKEED